MRVTKKERDLEEGVFFFFFLRENILFYFIFKLYNIVLVCQISK